MPKEIKAIDLNKLTILYQKILLDEDLMAEIFEVINYSIPKMKFLLEDGRSKYEYIEKHLIIEPVGVLPLYKNEGYFILDCINKSTQVYKYQITGIQTISENFIAIHTELVSIERKSLSNHYQQIKQNLIKKFRELPNPATFVVHSQLPFPVKQALLPITERLILQQIAA